MAIVFNAPNISLASASHGIYRLYDGNTLIYIGRAEGQGVTIRSRLQSHLNGHDGPCTQRATGFDYEVTHTPGLRESIELAAYSTTYGRLPRCNERIG